MKRSKKKRFWSINISKEEFLKAVERLGVSNSLSVSGANFVEPNIIIDESIIDNYDSNNSTTST